LITPTPAATADALRAAGDPDNYRVRRSADEFYRRSRMGSLFYAVSYALVDSIARYDRISLWLLVLPIAVFLASIWLRTRHQPPKQTAGPDDYRRWVSRHWLIIHFGLLLWGGIVAAVGWREVGLNGATLAAIVCTIAHATAASHAYGMYPAQGRLAVFALMGPGALTFFLPGLHLWPAGVVLLVYSIYLMATLRHSAKEYDRQMSMEIQLAREVAQQRAIERDLRAVGARNELLVADLRSALDKVKTLSGLLPVCGWCHKVVRNEEGGWERIDKYLAERTNVQVSHGMCPECFARLDAADQVLGVK
jgi:hypothetical protein